MRKALRDLGLLLSAASYGPFGAFGSILEASDTSHGARLSPLTAAVPCDRPLPR